jgi:hypothetical protein
VPVAAAPQDIEAPAHHQATQQQQQQLVDPPLAKRTAGWKLLNYCTIPLALPLLAAWWLLALLLAVAATFSIWPSLLLARRLYWACPFIPCIWDKLGRDQGWVASWLLRLQFEGAHCMTVLGRLLSLPLRPHLPHFYILGFPVRGCSLLTCTEANDETCLLSVLPQIPACLCMFVSQIQYYGGRLPDAHWQLLTRLCPKHRYLGKLYASQIPLE